MYREKEVMYTVYQHKNLRNDKSYIGMTSLEPKKRWENGLSGYRNNQQMYNDIKNSDWNTDWEHNILGQFEDKQEALNVEEMFIWLFDSINEGYNKSSYSSHSCKHSEESKQKMSEAKTGEKAYWYGKHHSEESKQKMSENRPSKLVLQFSKDGELIAEYSSIHEAERHTGLSASNICNCCKGNRKSAGGFIWKYKEI